MLANMELKVSINDITNSPQHETQQLDAKDGFHTKWKTTDAAFLHPSNLSIGRVQRAWERRPLSPLTRRKIRVGKIWKRAVIPNIAQSGPITTDVLRDKKRLKAYSHVATPVKPVKKLRLDSACGVNARVSQWEERHTPARKIATRSTATDLLLSLSEDHHEGVYENQKHATIEILDEAGNFMENEVAEDDSWCDLGDEQDNTKLDFDEAMVHIGDLTTNDELQVKLASRTSVTRVFEIPQSGPSDEGAVNRVKSIVTGQAALRQEGSMQEVCMDNFPRIRTVRAVDLPDGFVSPAKRRRLGVKPSQAVTLARRQTLPVQFAPRYTTKVQSIEASDNLKHSSSEGANDQISQGNSDAHESSMPICAIAKTFAQEDSSFEETSTHQNATIEIDTPQLCTPDLEHSTSPLLHNSDCVEEAKAVLERSSSAPPEKEPRPLSPEKTFKPRLSDDTALLQAFLNRAAENRSARRMSVTAQESLSNRRDSDTVRQALASPVAATSADILGELDPNSPSPRKPGTNAAQPEMAVLRTIEHAEDSIEDEGSAMKTNTRRSGRGRKKPEMLSQATYSGPPRITIRGPAATNSVDVKKSEAQELAQLTRSNTRKNKGGSVLPPLRLAKLAIANSAASQDEPSRVELSTVDADAEIGRAEVVGDNCKREVKWAETLVSYYEGQDPETSLVSDGQPEERLPWERPTLPDEDDDKPKTQVRTAHLAPADTPIKPKMRRLKTARTASTPAKVTYTRPAGYLSGTEDHLPMTEEKSRSKSIQKRSRIATPAKGPTGSSLLSSDPEPVPIAPKISGVRKAASKKKLTSKLPAPISSATSLGQGKENLIASPPKKKAASTNLPAVKTFASKIDFGKAKLESEQLENVPSLMSPAKKGRGRAAVIFGNGLLPAGTLGDEEKKMRSDVLPPGMRSPAKKRTVRRAAA